MTAFVYLFIPVTLHGLEMLGIYISQPRHVPIYGCTCRVSSFSRLARVPAGSSEISPTWLGLGYKR